jgi:hypothetical protein
MWNAIDKIDWSNLLSDLTGLKTEGLQSLNNLSQHNNKSFFTSCSTLTKRSETFKSPHRDLTKGMVLSPAWRESKKLHRAALSLSNEETPACAQCANKEIVSGNEIAFNFTQRQMRNDWVSFLALSWQAQYKYIESECPSAKAAIEKRIIILKLCTRPWLQLIVSLLKMCCAFSCKHLFYWIFNGSSISSRITHNSITIDYLWISKQLPSQSILVFIIEH